MHDEIRRYEFDSKIFQMQSILKKIESMFENFEMSFIQLILNINDQIIDVLKNFSSELINVTSNYEKFYFKHFTQHFFQMKNYSMIEKRSRIKISISSIFFFFYLFIKCMQPMRL